MEQLDADLAEGSQDFICSICTHIAMRPLSINCPHVYCETCLRKWVASNPSCPCCKASIDISKAIPNKFVSNMIEKLKFKCPNFKSGCGFMDIAGVDMRNLKTHLDKCQFQPIPCSLCQIKHLRKAVADHEKTLCLERRVTCNKCSSEMPFRLLSPHQQNDLKCENFILCPHGCKKEMLRSSLSKHEEDCPDKMIECEQCDIKLQRKDLANHDAQSIAQHFRVMQKRFREQQEASQNQIRELQKASQLQLQQIKEQQKLSQNLQNTIQTQRNELEALKHKTEEDIHQLEQSKEILERFVINGEDGMSHFDTNTTEEFLWNCRDSQKQTEFECISPALTMNSGYKFHLSAESKGKSGKIEIYIFFKEDDALEWPFPFPFTLATLKPSINSRDYREELTQAKWKTCFGPSPTEGVGLTIDDESNAPLLVRVVFHLDEKIPAKRRKK